MRTVLRWGAVAVAAGLVLVLVIQLWYLGWIAWWKWNNPTETSFMAREVATLRQTNPKLHVRHRWVPYESISIHLKRAVITSEDARFAEHEGVDWDAIEKAYKENLKRGRPARGGSTITQQLAKNLFLSPDRSYVRKGQELAITYMIEALWDKRRILEVYLNVVEWGEGVFGAEAAARHYYGVPAARLGAEQAARLAAYLPNPKRYGRLKAGPYLDRRTADIARYMPDAVVP
jgi:monofunctional glycosyltransferase